MNKAIGRSAGEIWRSSPARSLLVSFFVLASPDANAAGAVDVAAQEATQSLGQMPGASVVVAAPLTSDQATTRGDDLALRIAALVAGKIGAPTHAHPQTTQLATARAIAGRASSLVYVQSEIAKGDLRVTVDVYPSMGNAWDRIRNPLPSPTAHAFASAKVDAEVRAFLAPLLLEQASVHRARHEEGDVLAAACGDVDGDGGDEIVLVSRTRVAMGRVREGRFVVERAARWGSLSQRSSTPMREPLGGAVVLQGAVHVGTTDRGALSLTPDFAGHTPLVGVPAWGGESLVCLTAEPSAGAFDGAPIDCTASRAARPKMIVPSPRFDAFAASNVADARGNALAVVAVREPSGKLRLRMGDAPARVPDGTFGAQLAVGDLDLDGTPDIATSADGPEDAIDVYSWPSATADPRGRLHLAAPGGVRALALCAPEEQARPALLAVVGSELWLVRARARGATGR